MVEMALFKAVASLLSADTTEASEMVDSLLIDTVENLTIPIFNLVLSFKRLV